MQNIGGVEQLARFRSVARVRPLLAGERNPEKGLLVSLGKSIHAGDNEYSLDDVVDERNAAVGQEGLYAVVGKPVVTHTLNGYNTCVFAYGQSGSGKTHTTVGTPQDEGLIPRVLRALVEAETGTVSMTVSLLELYNEVPSCLLTRHTNGRSPVGVVPCTVRESPTTGPFVEGLQKVPVSAANISDVVALINEALGISRRVGETSNNAHSSRSHVLCTVDRSQFELETRSLAGISTPVCLTTSSRMCIVDLAGSERVGSGASTTSGGTPRGFVEGVAINQSLLTLGLVVNAVADAQSQQPPKVPPFRNSKLTYLLKDSLRGEAMTTVVATLRPNGTLLEFTDTLRFAIKCASIKTHIRRSKQVDASAFRASELAAENQILKLQLSRLTEALTRPIDVDSHESPKGDDTPKVAKDVWLSLAKPNEKADKREVLDVVASPLPLADPYYSHGRIQYVLHRSPLEAYLLPISPLPLTSERCGDRTVAYSLEGRVGAVRPITARFAPPEHFVEPPCEWDPVGESAFAVPFPLPKGGLSTETIVCWVRTEVAREDYTVRHVAEAPSSAGLIFQVLVDGGVCDEKGVVLRPGSTISITHLTTSFNAAFRYVSPRLPSRGSLLSTVDSGPVEASPVRRHLLVDDKSPDLPIVSPYRCLSITPSQSDDLDPAVGSVTSDDSSSSEGEFPFISPTQTPTSAVVPSTSDTRPVIQVEEASVRRADYQQFGRWSRSVLLAEEYVSGVLLEAVNDAAGDSSTEIDLLSHWRQAVLPTEAPALQAAIHDTCAALFPPFFDPHASLLQSILGSVGGDGMRALLHKAQVDDSNDGAAQQCCQSLLQRHLLLVDGWWVWLSRELSNEAGSSTSFLHVTSDTQVIRIFIRRNVVDLHRSSADGDPIRLFLSECVSDDYTTYPLPPEGFKPVNLCFGLYLLRRAFQIQNSMPATSSSFTLYCRAVVNACQSASTSPLQSREVVLPVRWLDWNHSSVVELAGVNAHVIPHFNRQLPKFGLEGACLDAQRLQLEASLLDAEREVDDASKRERETRRDLHNSLSEMYGEVTELRHRLEVKDEVLNEKQRRVSGLEAETAKTTLLIKELLDRIASLEETARFEANQKAALERRHVASQLELSRLLAMRQERPLEKSLPNQASSKWLFQRQTTLPLTPSNLSSLRPRSDSKSVSATMSRTSSMAGREPVSSSRMRPDSVPSNRPQSAISRSSSAHSSIHHQNAHRSGVMAGTIGPEVELPASHDSARRNRLMIRATPHEEQPRAHDQDESSPEPIGHADPCRFVLADEKEAVERQLEKLKMSTAARDREIETLRTTLDEMEAANFHRELNWNATLEKCEVTIRTLTLELDRVREMAVAKERARIRGMRAVRNPNGSHEPEVKVRTRVSAHHLPPSVVDQRSSDARRENRALRKELAGLRLELGRMSVLLDR